MAVEQYGAVLSIQYLGQAELRKYASDLQRAGAITEAQAERMAAAWERAGGRQATFQNSLRAGLADLGLYQRSLDRLAATYDRLRDPAVSTNALTNQIAATTARLDRLTASASAGTRQLQQMRLAYAELATLAGVVQQREALAARSVGAGQQAAQQRVLAASAALVPYAPAPVPIPTHPPRYLPPPPPTTTRAQRVDDRLEQWLNRQERLGAIGSVQYDRSGRPIGASTTVLGPGQAPYPTAAAGRLAGEQAALIRSISDLTRIVAGSTGPGTPTQQLKDEARAFNQGVLRQLADQIRPQYPRGAEYLSALGTPGVSFPDRARQAALTNLLTRGTYQQGGLRQILGPEFNEIAQQLGIAQRGEYRGQGRGTQFPFPGLRGYADPSFGLADIQQAQSALRTLTTAFRQIGSPGFVATADLLNTAAGRVTRALPPGRAGGVLAPAPTLGPAYGQFGAEFGRGYGQAIGGQRLLPLPSQFITRPPAQLVEGFWRAATDYAALRPSVFEPPQQPSRAVPAAPGVSATILSRDAAAAQRLLLGDGSRFPGSPSASDQQLIAGLRFLGRTAEQAAAAVAELRAATAQQAVASRAAATADQAEAVASRAAAASAAAQAAAISGPRGLTDVTRAPDGGLRALPQYATQPQSGARFVGAPGGISGTAVATQQPRPSSAVIPLTPLGNGNFGYVPPGSRIPVTVTAAPVAGGAAAGGAGGGGAPPFVGVAGGGAYGGGFGSGGVFGRYAQDFRTGFRGLRDRPYLEQIGQAFKFSVFYGASYSLLFQIAGVLQQALQEAVQFQQALTELSIVTGESVEYNRDLANRLGEIATQAGYSSFQGVEAGTRAIGLYDLTDASRQQQETAAQIAARTTSQLAFVSGREFDSIQLDVGAISQAFGLGYQSQSRIQDVDAFLTKRFGLKPGSTLETVAQIGTLGRDAGYSLEEVAALAAKLQSRTGQTPAAVAGLLSQFFGRSGDPALLGRLRSIGIDTSQGYRPAIQQLSAVAPDLGPNERAEVLNAFGRGRSSGAAKVIVEDLAEITTAAREASTESAGLGQQQFEERITNIGGILAQMSGSLNSFAKALGDSGVIELTGVLALTFKGLIESTTGLLELFSLLPGEMEAFVLAAGIATLALKSQAAQGFIGGALANQAGRLGGGGLLNRILGTRGGYYAAASPIGGGPAQIFRYGAPNVAGALPLVQGINPALTPAQQYAVGRGQIPQGLGVVPAPYYPQQPGGAPQAIGRFRQFGLLAASMINPMTLAIGGLLAVGQWKQEADEFAIQMQEAVGVIASINTTFEGYGQTRPEALEGLASQAGTAIEANRGPGFFYRLTDTIFNRSRAQAEQNQIVEDLTQYQGFLNELAQSIRQGTPQEARGTFGRLSETEIELGLELLTSEGVSAEEQLRLLGEAIRGSAEAAERATAAFSAQAFAQETLAAAQGALASLELGPEGIPTYQIPGGALGENAQELPIGSLPNLRPDLLPEFEQQQFGTGRAVGAAPFSFLGDESLRNPIDAFATNVAEVEGDRLVEVLNANLDPNEILYAIQRFVEERSITDAGLTSVQGEDLADLIASRVVDFGTLADAGLQQSDTALEAVRELLANQIVADLENFWGQWRQALDPDAVLSEAQQITALQGVLQTSDAAISAVPRGDLSGAIAAQEAKLAELRTIEERAGTDRADELIIQINETRADLAEAEIEKIERTRRAQQAAATSADQVIAIGKSALRNAVQVAVEGGNAEALADLIERGGVIAVEIAKKAIRDMINTTNAARAAALSTLRAAQALAAQQNAALAALPTGVSESIVRQDQALAARGGNLTPEQQAYADAVRAAEQARKDAERLNETIAATPAPQALEDSPILTGGDTTLSPSVRDEFADRFGDDAAAQSGPTAAQIAAARQAALVRPGDTLGQARANIAKARADMAAADANSIEYWNAVGALRDAQYELALAEADRAAAIANANAARVGGALAQSRAQITAAAAQMRAETRGTVGWYNALASWYQAREAHRQALLDYQRNRILLAGDVTDPVDQARAELIIARRRLRQDRARGAGRDVIAQDRVDVRQAQAQVEAARFQQRLNDVQHAERMGQLSHAQYVQYLNSEKERLESIANKSRQQIEQLQQIESLLKEASEQLQGQFNLGDVDLPTPYEVRRYITAQGAGVGFQNAPTVNNISIDGTDTRAVEQLLRQLLGESAFSTTTTAARKV